MIPFFRRCLLALVFTLPAVAGSPFDPVELAAIDDAIQQAVTDAKAPGGVFLMERDDTVYRHAYGDRAVIPKRERMTEDTIFDAASLTKVIATTSVVMKLIEDGKIDVESPLSHYFPDFKGNGKEAITVRQLLTHCSGLRSGLPAGKWSGKKGALEAACAEPLPNPPGTVYRYSDINFILLGLLVEHVAGVPLEDFCQTEIFKPLGMKDTGYRDLSGSDAERIAPTTVAADGTVLRGVVHDPTARRMGGVAGHAGLFTTADDLGRFARMMLQRGELDGTRILREETVEAMTTVQSPPGLPQRGFGWDIDSPYAGPRGAIFPVGSYGHTGWTGTRIWIDPFSQSAVIFLSNRNHPDERGNVIGLQYQLGTLAARALTGVDFPPQPAETVQAPKIGPVLNGIDVLKREKFRQLRGRTVGLVTNHTGIDRQRNTTIDLLHAAPDVKLVALFSPEHGIRGTEDREGLGDTRDEKTGLPVYSLYGERRSPSEKQLEGIDTLVFDIQDIGCRFYTYISTMTHCLEATGKFQRRMVVLDRVNPIGATVEGPVLSGPLSFVGIHEIPLRHGMTAGELARLINVERKFGADLGVIRCDGGSPMQWFDAVGLPWRDQSPNMRSLTEATLYPGVGLLEFCKVSVGRGTDTPFEVLGAPYIDDMKLATELNASGLPGVRFVPIRFTPTASVFAGEECGGVRFILTDRDSFRAADLGITLATALQRIHPDKLDLGRMTKLLADAPTLEAIRAGKSLTEIHKLWQPELEKYQTRRQPHLLYPR